MKTLTPNQTSKARAHLCLLFVSYSGPTISITLLNDLFNGNPNFTFNVNFPSLPPSPKEKHRVNFFKQTRHSSFPQSERAQSWSMRVVCEQRWHWPGLQLLVESKVAGDSALEFQIFGEQSCASLEKLSPHVVPGVGCR